MMPAVIAAEAVFMGIAAGFLAALAGFGGGFLYVPILILVFGLDPQDAVGTSLTVIIFTTLSASVSYLHQKRIFLMSAVFLLVPSIIFALAGAYLTAVVPGTVITLVFSVFIGMLGIKLILPEFPFVRPIEKGPSREETCCDSFSCTVTTRIYYVHYIFWGALAGLASGLSGIGGGVFHVPALVTSGMPVHYAVATSSLVVLGTSCAGAGIHAILGHIQLPYAISLSLGAVLGAYAGARTAPGISAHLLRKGIGTLLVVVAVIMLASTLLSS
jgi:hypothetical protein